MNYREKAQLNCPECGAGYPEYRHDRESETFFCDSCGNIEDGWDHPDVDMKTSLANRDISWSRWLFQTFVLLCLLAAGVGLLLVASNTEHPGPQFGPFYIPPPTFWYTVAVTAIFFCSMILINWWRQWRHAESE